MQAHLTEGVLECLVDRGWCGILVGHAALPGCSAGQLGEHRGDLFFGQVYLFAAVVTQD